jgi:hypothetical protein
MRGQMPKELSSDASLVELKLARRDITLDQARKLVAVAALHVLAGVQVDYSPAEGTSTATGDVGIDATAEPLLTLHAVVRVKATFKGDLRRGAFPLRKLATRLCEIAGQHCLEQVFKELADKVRGRH